MLNPVKSYGHFSVTKSRNQATLQYDGFRCLTFQNHLEFKFQRYQLIDLVATRRFIANLLQLFTNLENIHGKNQF